MFIALLQFGTIVLLRLWGERSSRPSGDKISACRHRKNTRPGDGNFSMTQEAEVMDNKARWPFILDRRTPTAWEENRLMSSQAVGTDTPEAQWRVCYVLTSGFICRRRGKNSLVASAASQNRHNTRTEKYCKSLSISNMLALRLPTHMN